MNILFHCTFSDQAEWLKSLKKKFKGHNFFTIKDKVNYSNISVAVIWNLPNNIYKKLVNVRLIFSLGAGVDHIINLPSYNGIPIIRIKDPNMRERMFNHTLSQILNFQLKLTHYQKAQQKKIWLGDSPTPQNKNLKIGILGLGYLGSFVAKKLQKLNYQIIGYKKTHSKLKLSFKVFTGKKINDFISSSDIIVSILPSTETTRDFIDKKFLKKMKKNSLLINIGRGDSLCEKDLLSHLKINKNCYVSLDVFKKEPLSIKHDFWKHPNITITPHVAAVSDIESSIDYMHDRFVTFKRKGNIESDVNLKKGY